MAKNESIKKTDYGITVNGISIDRDKIIGGEDSKFNLPFSVTYLNADSEVLKSNTGDVSLKGVLALLMCTEGYLEGYIDNELHRLNKYDAFMLSQSAYGKLTKVSPDFKAIAVGCDLEYYFTHIDNMIDTNIQIQLSEMTNISVPKKQFDSICGILSTLCRRIVDEENNDMSFLPPDRQIIRQNIIREMFISAINVLACELINIVLITLPPQPAYRGRKDEIVKEFMKLIHDNYQTHRDLKFYADKLFLSPKYLSSLRKTAHAPRTRGVDRPKGDFLRQTAPRIQRHVGEANSIDNELPRPELLRKILQAQSGNVAKSIQTVDKRGVICIYT